VEQALSGKPITIYGDGKQVRSFTWVNDAINAMIEVMRHPAAVSEIFNIGNEEPITIEELANKIKKKTNSNSEIVYIPYEEAYGPNFEDIRYRVPDLRKIKKLINYAPSTGIDQILEKVIEYQNQRKQAQL
jgi:UDP-glucose 4-epimerase